MITIIKQPTKQYQEKMFRKHFRCRHCGTEWLADPSDYQIAPSQIWINHIEQENYKVNCPICGWQLYLYYYEVGKTWENVPFNQTEVESFI